MKWVIAYDIRRDSSRSRVARRLERAGFRRQYSVFEGELSPKQLDELFEELTEAIDPEHDCLTAWPTSNNGSTPMLHVGKPQATTKQDWLMI